MKLHKLPKINSKKGKSIGRGIGSGRGRTAGRGTKGQKARSKIPPLFVGGMPLHKKLPLIRGWGQKGKNQKRANKPIIIKLSMLNRFKAKSKINPENLIEAGLVSEKKMRNKWIKILGDEKIKIPLTVELPVSKKAKIMIEKAGGKVVS